MTDYKKLAEEALAEKTQYKTALFALHAEDLDKAHRVFADNMEIIGWTMCPYCMCVNLADFKSKSLP